MPKITLPIKHVHPTPGIGKIKGKIKSKAISVVKINLPLVSAARNANIKIMRTIMLTINRYGICMFCL